MNRCLWKEVQRLQGSISTYRVGRTSVEPVSEER